LFGYNPVLQIISALVNLFIWVLIIGGIIFVISRLAGSKSNEDEAMERWSALLPGRAESGTEFLDMVNTELEVKSNPFNTHNVKIGGSLATPGQPAIRIYQNNVYSCFISYEEVGKDLHITWTLHEKTSWLYSIPLIGSILYGWWHVVSLRDRNKLLAFSAFTKSCAENVVDSLMDKYNLDKSKLNRATSGKLGPL